MQTRLYPNGKAACPRHNCMHGHPPGISGLAVAPASTPVSSTLIFLAGWMPISASLAVTVATVLAEVAAQQQAGGRQAGAHLAGWQL